MIGEPSPVKHRDHLVNQEPQVGPQDIQVALRAFQRIADRWGLAEQERLHILGNDVKETDLAAWQQGERPPNEVIYRISYVLGIYKALQIHFSDPEIADNWVKLPNRAFKNETPLTYMQGDIDHLAAVRDYLDGMLEGWG